MNYNFFIVVFWLLSFPFFQVTAQIKVKATIKEVTVFLSGAEISSEANTTLPAGNSEIVIEQLSPNINTNTIQVKGVGSFVILGVQHQFNYLNTQTKPKEIMLLTDSLEILQDRLNGLSNLRNVYENEESFLLANKNIGGNNSGVNAAELEKIAVLLRTRLTDLKIKKQEIIKSEKKLNEQIIKINNSLRELNAKREQTAGEIVISVFSKQGSNAQLSISYFVSSASWSPFYDIRAMDTKSPISIILRANVLQNTGEDWKNVKLTLSTGNPTVSGTQPIINPWWLSFSRPIVQRDQFNKFKSRDGVAAAPSTATGTDERAVGVDVETRAESISQYTTTSENPTNFEYEISIPYNISANNKENSVEVSIFNIPTFYQYYCAPKLDKDAFLLAKITNWEQYNLIPGNANIYFEGTFVGKSYLNTQSTKDTLDISLGRDKSITISRTLLKDFSSKKIIGLNKKVSFMYEISVRNKKKTEIEIEVEDQVPLTTTSEIEVEITETSSAVHHSDTGKLKWNYKILPAETQKIKFGYTVKFPKDKIISNL